ncbi:unnamed protein product [Caenorhabditis auriculariae]|uniref:Eukaryotic translation initiation factor 3 subunit G n=1 Tax=Caenorhabditis auriculariae TaxID=2777116 RepID=A0A8S1H6H3_9PELO|nr:unnamed protein product [Caenorhabditis auriculariae]
MIRRLSTSPTLQQNIDHRQTNTKVTSTRKMIENNQDVGSWAEAVEKETLSHETNEDGIKEEVGFAEENGIRYKVVTQFKVIKKKVPRVVADRKKWKKFGMCTGEPPGPQVATTYVAEEVEMQFTRNRAGEQILDVQEDKQVAKASNREHCRHCKGNDHWSTHCPYKQMYQLDEEVEQVDPEKDRGAGLGLRGDGRQIDRRSDENTCRVTNLPQEMEENELRDIFSRIGRVIRVFIARDKVTNLPKGFAFVTYESREDATRAIAKLNGTRAYHMILKVEWTQMGFLSILRKQKAREKEMRVLILGLDNGGKTTIMKKFLGEDLNQIEPTLGFDIKTVEFKGYVLNLWDVGGQKSLRSYWRNYFEQTDALIWVVDSGDKERLMQCKEELHKLLVEERLAGATLLVLANKHDLPSALDVHAISKLLDLDSIKTHHWRIFSCCAINGEHLLDSIEWLTDDVGSRVFTLE